jgi:hypothetical protein
MRTPVIRSRHHVISGRYRFKSVDKLAALQVCPCTKGLSAKSERALKLVPYASGPLSPFLITNLNLLGLSQPLLRRFDLRLEGSELGFELRKLGSAVEGEDEV